MILFSISLYIYVSLSVYLCFNYTVFNILHKSQTGYILIVTIYAHNSRKWVVIIVFRNMKPIFNVSNQNF